MSRLLGVLALAVTAGCSSGDGACLRHSDCKAGQSCSSGSCIAGSTAPPGELGDGSVDGPSVKDSSSDRTLVDVGVSFDATMDAARE